MKKLFIITTLLLLSFTINLKQVDAVTYDAITWTDTTLTGTNQAMIGRFDTLNSIDVIEFTIPSSNYHTLRLDSGGPIFVPTVTLEDELGATLETLTWTEFFGDDLDGTFYFSIKDLGHYQDVYSISILIPQTYVTGAIPGGYHTYMTDNASVNQYYVPFTDYMFMRSETVSYTYIYIEVDVPYNTYSFTLDLRNIDYYVTFNDIYNSSVYLLYESRTVADTLRLKDYVFTDTGLIQFTIPYDPLEYEVNDIYTLQIVLYVDDIFFETIDDINSRFDVVFNSNALYQVNYISQGSTVSSAVVFENMLAPEYTPTAPTGFSFVGWTLGDGTPYNFTAINSSLATNDIVNLYANYKISTSLDDIDTTDPTVDSGLFFLPILTDIGFNNSTGYIITFIVTILIVTILLLFLKLPIFLILMIDLIVLVTFTFFNILPLYVTAIGYIIIISGIIMTLKGGR